jgi:hypothetical protein
MSIKKRMMYVIRIFALLLICLPGINAQAQQQGIDDEIIYKSSVIKARHISKQTGWLTPNASVLSLYDTSKISGHGRIPILISEFFFNNSGYACYKVQYDLYGHVSEKMIYNDSGLLLYKVVYRANDPGNKIGHCFSMEYGVGNKLSGFTLSFFDSLSSDWPIQVHSPAEKYKVFYNRQEYIDSVRLEVVSKKGKDVKMFHYYYDAAGRLLKIDELTDPNSVIAFKYDVTGKLIESSGSEDPIIAPRRNIFYSYKDELPEKSKWKDEGLVTFSYQ